VREIGSFPEMYSIPWYLIVGRVQASQLEGGSGCVANRCPAVNHHQFAVVLPARIEKPDSGVQPMEALRRR